MGNLYKTSTLVIFFFTYSFLMGQGTVTLNKPLDKNGDADLTPTFSWSSSGTGTLDNILHIDTDPDPFTGGTEYDVDAATTHTLVSSLTAGTIYYWGVELTDDGGTVQSEIRMIMPCNTTQADSLTYDGVEIANSLGRPNKISIGDIDGDGDMDIATVSETDYKIRWFENDGSESFTKYDVYTLNTPRDVEIADIDNDGDMDLIVVQRTTTLSTCRLFVFYNDGSESFTISSKLTSIWQTGGIDVADIDSDGDLDVVIQNNSIARTTWAENDGSGNFTNNVIATAATNGGTGTDPIAVDLDEDGDMDIVACFYSDDEIVWYENDGSESFTRTVVSTNADGATGVEVVDLDGDGDLDILSSSFNDDQIMWYENNGSESFTETAIASDADGASSVQAGDIDGDGDVDILTTSENDQDLRWYENDGSESFTKHEVTTTSQGVKHAVLGDIDGDGDLDAVAGDYIGNQLFWYENISSVLPVELLHFSAENEGGRVVIKWKTAAEINNDYFLVQKSTNGVNWETIANIAGAGNSALPIDYSAIDNELVDGPVYYRLKQVDYDGTSETFKAVVLNGESSQNLISVEVSPNPVLDNAKVNFGVPQDGLYKLVVFNVNGETVESSNITGVKGQNWFDYNMSLFESGVYYFTIQNEKGEGSFAKVVKL